MKTLSFRMAGLAATGAFVLQLAGCASFEFTKAPPVAQRPVAVKLSGEELSGWTDLPLGVYRVPDSHVMISGHQTGGAAPVLLFGLVGLAAQHAGNVSAGANLVKDAEQQLKLKLDGQVNAALDRLAAEPANARVFARSDAPGRPRVLLTPGLVLSFLNGGEQVRPFVVLKATMPGTDGKPAWNTRYIASGAETRPLLGDSGWLAGGGAAFRDAVDRNLELALRAMVAELANPAPRDEKRLAMVQAHFPFMKQRVQTVGFPIAEDDQSLTYVPRLGDILVFTGVNVLDKRAISYRPATKDDAVLKLVD